MVLELGAIVVSAVDGDFVSTLLLMDWMWAAQQYVIGAQTSRSREV